MTDEDLALFSALDALGAWLLIDDGPVASRESLITEFGDLMDAVLDRLEERLGRTPVGPVDFQALLAEAEGRDDLLAHPYAVAGARILLERFEGEAEHFARGQAESN